MRLTKITAVAAGLLFPAATFAINLPVAPMPSDSVTLFAYSKRDGGSGLRLAWSEDNKTWHSISDSGSESRSGYNFVSSDFGPWGSHKKMFEPVLYKMPGGWRAIWYVSDKRETLASADSEDLIHWRPQRYAAKADSCSLGFCGLKRGERKTVKLFGKYYTGTTHRVDRREVEYLQSFVDSKGELGRLESELMEDDANRFDKDERIEVSTKVSKEKAPKRISDKLIGIFFEDISNAADGGLYAELIQNRDFEYNEFENRKKGWCAAYAWSLTDRNGNEFELNIDTVNPIHPNNPHYIHVESPDRLLYLKNVGFDGICFRKGESYQFSMFARNRGKNVKTKFGIDLLSEEGDIVGNGYVEVRGDKWHEVDVDIKAVKTAEDGSIRISIPRDAECDMDMISLFPERTYKGRRNGLRADLAETLANLKPKFIRFPGGCVAHGDGIDNIYDWKGSIGPLESRKPFRNIWNYHQTRGLGYYEYFLMCEDMGAEPLPVLAAGVPCQNSGRPYGGSYNELTSLGQQGGIPMAEMDSYVQDILDLIEYANGSADTEWGRKRAEAGHPAPFNLKYIGIGNEDMITEVFEQRFKYINDVLKSEHPEITVVGTAGPFYEGSDYEEGWRFAKEEGVAIVDEHYYVSPGWYLNHRDFYDSYDRNGPKVYLGEYASHLPDRKNTLETALTVALYLTDVERNGDVVDMTSYAPLLAKKGHENWRPDMIFFTNDSIYLTPDYYVQQLYGQNSGSVYIPMDLVISNSREDVTKRIGHSVVKDDKTGDLIIKIANLTPMELDWNENLSDITEISGSQEMEVLSGNPSDECTKTRKESVFMKEGRIDVKVAPYSFNVIRLRK